MKSITKKVIILLVMIIALCRPVFADVGGVQRYDGSKSSSTSTSSANGLIGLIFSPTGLIIVIVVGGGLFYWGKKKGIVNDITDITKMGNVVQEFKNEVTMNIDPDMAKRESSSDIANRIRQIDPMFSEENFLNWTKDVFVKLQNAWTKKDWTIIRPFESNQLFELHSAQLQEYIKTGRTNIVEKIAVQKADIIDFKQDGDKEIIKINLRATMIDYIIDDQTQNVLQGSKVDDQYMSYILTFMRKAGIKTQEGKSNKSTTNCPNCGAPTQITSAGQCEYCGSVITTGEHDWVLTELRGI